jgi:hypothetical protein
MVAHHTRNINLRKVFRQELNAACDLVLQPQDRLRRGKSVAFLKLLVDVTRHHVSSEDKDQVIRFHPLSLHLGELDHVLPESLDALLRDVEVELIQTIDGFRVHGFLDVPVRCDGDHGCFWPSGCP